MKTSTYFLLFTGLGLFTILVGYHGVTDVAAALAVAGWGLIWVFLFRLIPIGFNTVAWQILLDEDERPSFKTMLWARWSGESVKGLLPMALRRFP